MSDELLSVHVPEGHEWALPAEESGFHVLARVDEFIDNGGWSSPKMSIMSVGDRGEPLEHADLPWCNSGVIVLRGRAIREVGSLLDPFGVLLPLDSDGEPLALFRAHAVDGVLDTERSEIVRFSSGRILDIVRPVFHSDRVPESAAFRLAERPSGPTLLTASLVARIVATGLSSGTSFRPIRT